MGFLLRGRLAQWGEFLSIVLILVGIVSLCQPFSAFVFRIGFIILLTGWIGLTVFRTASPFRKMSKRLSSVSPTMQRSGPNWYSSGIPKRCNFFGLANNLTNA